MSARERWVSAATEILGSPVVEAVPVARRKSGSALFMIAGAAVFAAVVFLHEFGVIPGPGLIAYFVGSTAMVVLFQMVAEPVFAAQTRDGGIWMLTGSRISPRPVALIGQLDPDHVSGSEGLLGNTFVIAGTKHQVGAPHKSRFQQMVESARRPLAG